MSKGKKSCREHKIKNLGILMKTVFNSKNISMTIMIKICIFRIKTLTFKKSCFNKKTNISLKEIKGHAVIIRSAH